MEHRLTLTIRPSDISFTVGQLLRTRAGLTKKQISQAKFRHDGITKNGHSCRTTDSVRPGDILTVCLEQNDSGSDHLKRPLETMPPLKILYEDSDLLMVNKPAGVVTHPSGKHYNDSLSNQVYWYLHNKGENITVRSVGRLDKETSGIVIFAKNKLSASRLQSMLHTGQAYKEYLAVVSGKLPQASSESPHFAQCLPNDLSFWNMIDLPIGPDPDDNRKMMVSDVNTEECLSSSKWKSAATYYRVLYTTAQWSLVVLRLATGRTHQIRVHMKAIGHPLLGDTLYGSTCQAGSVPFTRTALHAWHMSILHPLKKEDLFIEASLPEDFLFLMKYL